MAMTGGTAVLLKTGYPNYGAETSFPLRLYLYYKVVSQNKATGVTTMSLGMYFVCPDKWYVGAWSDYGSYLGTTSNTFSKSVPSNFTGTLWLVENVAFNVQHDAQGKGTAKIAWKWGVDSSYGQFESPSGTYNVSLPDIPRTSSVSVGGAVNAGSALAIAVGRSSSSFTHTLRYVFGSASGTIATGVGTSYNWTVPYDLLRQIPSATSGVGTIYCDTYYGSTLVGTSSCGFTVNAPNNNTTKPTASMMLSPSGSVPSAFSGMYIRGKTAVKADFSAEPKYGTSIKSYALSVNGKTTTGDPATSAVLSTSGTVSVTGTVTDARGFARTLSQNITVHAYDAPGVAPGTGQNAVICERANADGISSPSGTYIRIIAKRKYSSVDGKNKCTLRYRVKLASASSYGSWATLLADTATEDEYSGTIANVVSSVTTSYDVQIGVVDTMGTEATITFRIPTDAVSLHIREGGKGAAFFGYSEKDGELSLSGRRISNVGKPTAAGDAIPKGYVLPIAEGGTDATTAAKALANLGALDLNIITDDEYLVTSGADLNNYTTPGAYRIATAAIAASLKNAPAYTSAGGRLIVSALSTANNACIQLIVYNTRNYQVHFRIMDGTLVWGEWRALMADNIVAQGTSGEWNYRKWSSGLAECYRYCSTTPTAGAGLKYYTVTLPFAFNSSNYYVGITGTKASNTTYAHDFYASNSSANDGRTTGSVEITYTYSSSTAYTIGFTVYVMGRWK